MTHTTEKIKVDREVPKLLKKVFGKKADKNRFFEKVQISNKRLCVTDGRILIKFLDFDYDLKDGVYDLEAVTKPEKKSCFTHIDVKYSDSIPNGFDCVSSPKVTGNSFKKNIADLTDCTTTAIRCFNEFGNAVSVEYLHKLSFIDHMWSVQQTDGKEKETAPLLMVGASYEVVIMPYRMCV